jgi:hypothetical protein
MKSSAGGGPFVSTSSDSLAYVLSDETSVLSVEICSCFGYSRDAVPALDKDTRTGGIA